MLSVNTIINDIARESDNIMKKLENINKTMTAENINDIIAEIVNNDNVDVSTLSDREKFCVLIYAEMRKALDNKSNKLLLDANYAQSKFHNTEQYKVDYFRYISTDTTNDTMIQFYVSANNKTNKCKFRVCFSCAKTVRAQQKALEENHFTVQYNKKTNRAKTTQRTNIDYTEIVSVVKTICSILASANTAQQSEQDATAD